MGREKWTCGARGLQDAVERRFPVAVGCCSGLLGARGRCGLGAVGARPAGARGAGRALVLGVYVAGRKGRGCGVEREKGKKMAGRVGPTRKREKRGEGEKVAGGGGLGGGKGSGGCGV